MAQLDCYQRLRQLGRAVRALLAALLLLTLVVGTPWGLVRFIGWPLPDHLTTWSEVQDLLLTPLSTSFLLNSLACLLWLTWAVFVLDVARATLDIVHTIAWPQIRPKDPMQALATALVGTIVLTLATSRSTLPGTPTQATTVADHSAATLSSPAPAPLVSSPKAQTPQVAPATIVVRPPHDGIYDSLWRIAERELGDGHLWPKIYTLNKSRPQPDGRALTAPGLIRPGWILRLPDTPRHPRPGHDDHPPTSPDPSPRPTTPGPPSTQPASSTPQPPSRAANDPAHQTNPEPGISLPTGAFVSLGLAALITAACLSVRWRRRMHYHPGSGRRDDLAFTPTVRALRTANDQARLFTDTDTPDFTHTASADPTHEAASGEHPALAAPPRTERVIATKDGQARALDLARTRGLGLVGPGAFDAFRALIITLLAERHSPQSATVILIPAQDVHLLVGENAPLQPQLSRLHIVDNLDAALDKMEAELLTRARQGAATTSDIPRSEELVLAATPVTHVQRRLQAILDNGSSLGLAGVLLGQWRPGETARIRSDGTVAAISGPAVNSLAEARLFTLPPPDSQALLSLLSEADDPAPRAQGLPTTETEVRPPPEADGDSRMASAASPSGPTDSPVSLSTNPRRTGDPQPSDTSPQLAPTSEPGSHTSSPSDPHTSQETDSLFPEPPRDIGIRDRRWAEAPLHNPPKPSDEGEQQNPSPASSTRPYIPLMINVIGHLQTTYRRGDHHEDITSAFAPRQREVLAFLALHPDGARRETLTSLLWPEAPADRPHNALHATLSQLRRALRTATHGTLTDVIARRDNGAYALDRDQVSVDLWEANDILDAARPQHSTEHRLAAVQRLDELYLGDLADGVNGEWIEAPRESLRRDVLDAFSALAHTIDEADPEQALNLLERARTLDRYNEVIYQEIARLQARLGHREAVTRTLALLTTTLAELGEHPSQETASLCESLQRPRSTHPSRDNAS